MLFWRLNLNRAPLIGTVLNRVDPRGHTIQEPLGAVSYPGRHGLTSSTDAVSQEIGTAMRASSSVGRVQQGHSRRRKWFTALASKRS